MKRLETAVALCGKECAEQTQLRTPAIAAAVENIAGGIAVFAGVDSPITQAVGIGLDGPVSAQELDRLEDFYFSRGAPVNLELCPFIDPSLVELLGKRPYRLAEFSNVLVRELHAGEEFAPATAGVTIRIAERSEAKHFTRILMDGFAEGSPVTQLMLDTVEGFFHRTAGCRFYAMVDGELAGGAGLDVQDGLALMAGASTLPQFRKRGAQTALLAGRLAWAAQNGCDLAVTITNPGTISAGRTRGILVGAQFALAIVLLAGAGLLIRSFLLLNAVYPGFDTTHLLTMKIRLPNGRYDDELRIAAFFDEAIRKVEALPGVRGAAVGPAVTASLRGYVPNVNIVIEGGLPTQDVPRHGRELVSDGYFRTLGIPLRLGRLFSSGNRRGGPGVAVLNEATARHFWPSESSIGKRFKQVLPGEPGQWIMVPIFYMPSRQWSLIEMPLVVRTEHEPLNLAAAVRREVRSVDPAVPYFEIATAGQRLQELDRPRRFQTDLIGLFAATALILAALGLYGLTSYSVEQRTKEIGIRVALSASSGQVARLILGQSMRWALAGVVIGIGGTLVLGHALSSLLFGIGAADPATLATVTAVLAGVSAAASILPMRRAARVDPNMALRHK